ncbi:DNA-binding response regulator in two-component regulatory system with PhoR (or CreC) [Candidatus Terasakiella magnetica]|uniref:Phosphate regulon transcriptional regulatory protein PhoB n=1 Tax=Candidatus Terasakiella magnetica TaxID=1867952 RepID=A0A1C3RCA3_9PROT|nr:phosphate regulon transcriptional regulator PhoB [Candidatus Terasakiella magnetica]SCA54895.1 DNA-binding response regulator in two-component regulatory system with PhoR (or CreC) [Candidatus Terasakiella magnetica]
MDPLVLIVEDEPPLAELVRYNIEKQGFRALCVADGEEAMLLVEEEEPDLIILDWMLPGLSGIEVCRRLRERKETKPLPIIMLTARGEESDRIRGLDNGADDYIVKPFSPNELVARAKAVLRRASPTLTDDKLTYEDILMDLSEHKVMRETTSIHLGPTEYRLLRVLMERPGRVFSREQLLDKVWGRDIHVEVRTVDVHIRRLRKALSIDDKPDFIRTVRAAGYSLDSSV